MAGQSPLRARTAHRRRSRTIPLTDCCSNPSPLSLACFDCRKWSSSTTVFTREGKESEETYCADDFHHPLSASRMDRIQVDERVSLHDAVGVLPFLAHSGIISRLSHRSTRHQQSAEKASFGASGPSPKGLFGTPSHLPPTISLAPPIHWKMSKRSVSPTSEVSPNQKKTMSKPVVPVTVLTGFL